MGLTLAINGQSRSFEELESATLASLIKALQLKGDRIGVEYNGELVERSRWTETKVNSGDRLEIVHFVGGGSDGLSRGNSSCCAGMAKMEGSRGVLWRTVHNIRYRTLGLLARSVEHCCRLQAIGAAPAEPGSQAPGLRPRCGRFRQPYPAERWPSG